MRISAVSFVPPLIDLGAASNAFFCASPQGHVCSKCGSLLSPFVNKSPAKFAALGGQKWQCSTCESGEHIEVLAFPYVFRYLVAELAAMNIKVSLDIKRVGS